MINKFTTDWKCRKCGKVFSPNKQKAEQKIEELQPPQSLFKKFFAGLVEEPPQPELVTLQDYLISEFDRYGHLKIVHADCPGGGLGLGDFVGVHEL